MDFTTLGRTGLNVSVAGLGCGGHSRLGLSHGQSEGHAADIVRTAIDEGINLIDTARYYRTEPAIGKALQGRDRDSLVICTKIPIRRDHVLIDPARIRRDLEDSLDELQTDFVDVLYLHGVAESDYDFAVAACVPVLEELRRAGKTRFLGVTESFSIDPTHAMLSRATRDPFWDVVMVGFNILNQTARQSVLPSTQANTIGTTLMFAVRRALSQPETLREVIARLISDGHTELEDLDPVAPLGFLLQGGGARSIPDAAYRFCRHEPGVDCVLFGTGNRAHVRENIDSILSPPLRDRDLERLQSLFANVKTESGN